MIEVVPTGQQPARMVWAAIWIGSDGVVGRSPLVIMKRDSSRRRAGCTAWSCLQALTEVLLPNYSAGELFMRDNARIHTARISQRWLKIHVIETIDWPPYSQISTLTSTSGGDLKRNPMSFIPRLTI